MYVTGAKRRSQAERLATTRTALINAGLALFSEHGYSDSTAAQIVAAAGVTRGALYHHFPDGKAGLFRAVFETLEQDLDGRVREAGNQAVANSGNVIDGLIAGFAEFFASCAEPGVRRIYYQDAPTVLGWDTWRRIDRDYAVAGIEYGLEHLIKAGILAPQPLAPLTTILYGASLEAGRLVVDANGDPAFVAGMTTTMERLIRMVVRESSGNAP